MYLEAIDGIMQYELPPEGRTTHFSVSGNCCPGTVADVESAWSRGLQNATPKAYEEAHIKCGNAYVCERCDYGSSGSNQETSTAGR